MLTYSFENLGNTPLYEHLYKCIKEDILAGKLKAGEKLPSKRAFAVNLNISTITIETAYGQLMAEGYIQSKPKSGYFVAQIDRELLPTGTTTGSGTVGNYKIAAASAANPNPRWLADFTSNEISQYAFPFQIWGRIMKSLIQNESQKLVERTSGTGAAELKDAIAAHLQSFRNMKVTCDQIVIGAGAEYLYGMIIRLLGQDKIICLENPGYSKIRNIYKSNGVKCVLAGMEDSGIRLEDLRKTDADIVHISPSHHFPTGNIMSISKRYELLGWANEKEGRFIIEDDYDSELRFTGKPIPPLWNMDTSGRVIYLNTFSKTLSPTIRISYMVLSEELTRLYREKLSFLSCTVSNFEQYTLAKFISEGYFEKHLNRMRTFYRKRRNAIIGEFEDSSLKNRIKIIEESSGLHFLISIKTEKSDQQIKSELASRKINIQSLGEFYDLESGPQNENIHTFIINYSSITDDEIKLAIKGLEEVI